MSPAEAARVSTTAEDTLARKSSDPPVRELRGVAAAPTTHARVAQLDQAMRRETMQQPKTRRRCMKSAKTAYGGQAAAMAGAAAIDATSAVKGPPDAAVVLLSELPRGHDLRTRPLGEVGAECRHDAREMAPTGGVQAHPVLPAAPERAVAEHRVEVP